MTETVMTSKALFERLSSVTNPPTEEEFADIEKMQAEITPLLLSEIVTFSNNPDEVGKRGEDYIRHIVSIFILAYFREKKAYPLIIQLISTSGDKVVKLTGEVFTEALGRILASVYDDIAPIKSVIENSTLNPWLRCGALDSLMVLWKEDVLSRNEVIDYLKELLESKLEKISSYVWDSIALIAYDLHPRELEELLIQVMDENLISPIVLNPQLLKSCIKDDVNETIKNKDNVVDGYIQKPAQELTWWLSPDEKALEKGFEYASVGVPIVEKKIIPGERSMPMGWRGKESVVNIKIGRNEQCPCGSGRKYKKCCAN